MTAPIVAKAFSTGAFSFIASNALKIMCEVEGRDVREANPCMAIRCHRSDVINRNGKVCHQIRRDA